ncbi:MAG TPA: CoA transferase [Nocardioides sp.]|nr:CoA transferase [Nocardioides sp.]
MQPLEGLLVVGLEVAVSAPACTRQLADLGARVVKIESPAGDFARYYDESVPGASAHFAWVNRGKESVVLDLKSEVGREAVERLLAKADVFVQNLAPGAAAKLGLDARSILERHPRVVAVDISGYGEGGPRSDGRAYDLLIQAEGGSCAVTGWPDKPAKPGIPMADFGTGLTAANAVLGALIGRGTTGKGTAITLGMFDVVTDWMQWALHQARATGRNPEPRGVSSPMVSPYGAYRTADDQVIVIGTTNDAEWRRLADVIGRSDLGEDPRYATTPGRVEHRDELDAAIGEWTSQCTLIEAAEAAHAAQLGWARLNAPLDILEHPQLTERGRWVQTPVGEASYPSLRPAADLLAYEWTPSALPTLGEHTEGVLAELGLPEAY